MMVFSWTIGIVNPYHNLLGGFNGFNPSEKYESQLGWWNSQYMEKQKNVPKHQPVMVWWYFIGLLG